MTGGSSTSPPTPRSVRIVLSNLPILDRTIQIIFLCIFCTNHSVPEKFFSQGETVPLHTTNESCISIQKVANTSAFSLIAVCECAGAEVFPAFTLNYGAPEAVATAPTRRTHATPSSAATTTDAHAPAQESTAQPHAAAALQPDAPRKCALTNQQPLVEVSYSLFLESIGF